MFFSMSFTKDLNGINDMPIFRWNMEKPRKIQALIRVGEGKIFTGITSQPPCTEPLLNLPVLILLQ